MKNILWSTVGFGLLCAVAHVGCAESDEKSNDADKATFTFNHLCQQLGDINLFGNDICNRRVFSQ
ncbi:uncharacterized protein LOC142591100 isoform X4 [Dermacentor variabilis]|uniref:uncharacterized protein LOC142591100 isoform X4 n=1 Tax=Dermacentor variabilis TaxID=34621 RepID=UPI003F5B0345